MEDDHYTRITLRIPKELHQLIQNSAHKTSKSVNAEIIGRLQESFTQYISPGGLLSSNAGLPVTEDIRNNPDLYRHVASIPGEFSSDQLKEQAKRQAAEIQTLFERAFIPQLKTVLEEYKEQERNERKRLMEIALGGAEPFSKTKKPKV